MVTSTIINFQNMNCFKKKANLLLATDAFKNNPSSLPQPLHIILIIIVKFIKYCTQNTDWGQLFNKKIFQVEVYILEGNS